MTRWMLIGVAVAVVAGATVLFVLPIGGVDDGQVLRDWKALHPTAQSVRLDEVEGPIGCGDGDRYVLSGEFVFDTVDPDGERFPFAYILYVDGEPYSGGVGLEHPRATSCDALDGEARVQRLRLRYQFGAYVARGRRAT